MAAHQESTDARSATRAERRAARARRIDCAASADQPTLAAPDDAPRDDAPPQRDEPRSEDAHTIRTRRRA